MKILFLGDFFYNYEYIADDIIELSKWIKKNNLITILNLEGAITIEDKEKKIKKRGPNLCSNTIAVEVLKKLNVVGVCLANNHIMDFGNDGLCETIKILDDNNIKHCGAGKTVEESIKPFEICIEGKKITVYSFGWNIEETVISSKNRFGCASKQNAQNINLATKNENIVIYNMHWGFEYNRYPMPLDIQLGHKLIDNGVDLIIGHHPHCIQPKEVYKEKNIYYSLGNFYFSGRRKRFHNKFVSDDINWCDYGIGVIYNVEKNSCDEVVIKYDEERNRSFICTDNDSLIVDISNYKIDSKYKRLARESKKNINPILTGEKLKDSISLFILFLIYFFKNVVKILIRKG